MKVITSSDQEQKETEENEDKENKMKNESHIFYRLLLCILLLAQTVRFELSKQ